MKRKQTMKLKNFWLALALFCSVSLVAKAQTAQPWSKEKAWEWYNRLPWLNGVNYIPANAINYTAMWDKTSFSPKLIDSELQLMEDIGMNCVRVVMQHAVYADNPKYFKKAFGRFLDICERHGILVMPIFFDDCAFGVNTDPVVGRQPEPLEGWYAWAWSPSPGYTMVVDEREHGKLETYVKDVMRTFRDDKRIARRNGAISTRPVPGRAPKRVARRASPRQSSVDKPGCNELDRAIFDDERQVGGDGFARVERGGDLFEEARRRAADDGRILWPLGDACNDEVA